MTKIYNVSVNQAKNVKIVFYPPIFIHDVSGVNINLLFQCLKYLLSFIIFYFTMIIKIDKHCLNARARYP